MPVDMMACMYLGLLLEKVLAPKEAEFEKRNIQNKQAISVIVVFSPFIHKSTELHVY